jgi:DNA-binding transcriptional regulator LsrR (DeoR family)
LLAQGALEVLKEALPTSPKVACLGLGWGRATLAFVEAVEQKGGVLLGGAAEVVPLIGGSGQSLDAFQVNDLVRRVAKATGASARLLHAPALVKNEGLRAALLADSSVRPVVEAWSRLDVAVVGIGRRPDPTYATAEYLQDEYLRDESLLLSAVGDVCSHYFSADGEVVGEDHDARLVAVGREGLGRTPLTVGVAGGPEKVVGIVGAARARLISALVTDEETANGCLRIAEAA